MDAIHWTRINALVTARTELWNYDHIEIVVEDRSKRFRARPEASIAGNAHIHVDLQRRIFPQLLSLATIQSLVSTGLLYWRFIAHV